MLIVQVQMAMESCLSQYLNMVSAVLEQVTDMAWVEFQGVPLLCIKINNVCIPFHPIRSETGLVVYKNYPLS